MPNKNESATVAKFPTFHELNKGLVPDCMKASKVNIAINIPTPIHETSRKLKVVELEYKTMLAFFY